jgi:5'-3' exonuclease
VATKRLLLIDMLNQFIRQYVMSPRVSASGQPIGGVTGVLFALQKFIRESSPDLIFVCWDGEGGSQRRRAANKEYKKGRKPLHLNREISILSEEEEAANKLAQQMRLIEYLNCTPIIQLLLPHLEADDIIAYICHLKQFENWQKVIISSDKDFLQLCDDKTIVCRPAQNEIVNKLTVLKRYNIHPNNFAIARAIAGDRTDNLVGVRGAGLPTVAKRLPILATPVSQTLSDVFAYCQLVIEAGNKIIFYPRVLESEGLIEENYKLMQLYSPTISYEAAQHIQRAIKNHVSAFNHTQWTKMSIEDGIGTVNFADMFCYFRRKIAEKKKDAQN